MKSTCAFVIASLFGGAVVAASVADGVPSAGNYFGAVPTMAGDGRVSPASGWLSGIAIRHRQTAGRSDAQVTAVDPLLERSIGFYTGIAGLVDDARARELLLEAAADEDPLSMMWVARCYSRGRMNFDHDERRAREIANEVIAEVRRLAERNVAEAAFLMGTAHAEGLGVEPDEDTAFDWYFRAANLGNALAAHNLGNAYRNGEGMPRDAKVAAYWYHRAASRGDALPMFWLGEMYERGEGVARDLEQARHWYRESASRGRDDAQAALERLGG